MTKIGSSAFLVAAVLASLLVGCGGRADTDSTSSTASSAASPPAADQPGGAGASGASGASGSSGASAATGASGAGGERRPTEEPLPTDTGGATVVQGRYVVKISSESSARAYGAGNELSWGAVTKCDPQCVVELNRENASGGFVSVTLKKLSKTRYAAEGTGTARCFGVGPRRVTSRQRTSLSVLKVRDQQGVELATEIQGFVRERFKCATGRESEVLRVQGRLRE